LGEGREETKEKGAEDVDAEGSKGKMAVGVALKGKADEVAKDGPDGSAEGNPENAFHGGLLLFEFFQKAEEDFAD
jgi:hypothetical protein